MDGTPLTELLITRGYPASGKTTFAYEWAQQDPENRVKGPSRDDLRASLFNDHGVLSGAEEVTVSAAQKAAVRALLKSGRSVIVDDTNLRLRYARGWADVAAQVGVDFQCIDIRTPVDECLARNTLRKYSGGRFVPPREIQRMAQRFPLDSWKPVTDSRLTEFEPYVPDAALASAWIFDIDGTVAHMTGRSPYDYTRVNEDVPDDVVRTVNQVLDNSGAYMLFVSGRDMDCHHETYEWLHRNRFRVDGLYMRKSGDKRDDSIVKYEIFRDLIAPHYNVLGVFDDRNRVVDMWRRIGLKCFQVQEGDF